MRLTTACLIGLFVSTQSAWVTGLRADPTHSDMAGHPLRTGRTTTNGASSPVKGCHLRSKDNKPEEKSGETIHDLNESIKFILSVVATAVRLNRLENPSVDEVARILDDPDTLEATLRQKQRDILSSYSHLPAQIAAHQKLHRSIAQKRSRLKDNEQAIEQTKNLAFMYDDAETLLDLPAVKRETERRQAIQRAVKKALETNIASLSAKVQEDRSAEEKEEIQRELKELSLKEGRSPHSPELKARFWIQQAGKIKSFDKKSVEFAKALLQDFVRADKDELELRASITNVRLGFASPAEVVAMAKRFDFGNARTARFLRESESRTLEAQIRELEEKAVEGEIDTECGVFTSAVSEFLKQREILKALFSRQIPGYRILLAGEKGGSIEARIAQFVKHVPTDGIVSLDYSPQEESLPAKWSANKREEVRAKALFSAQPEGMRWLVCPSPYTIPSPSAGVSLHPRLRDLRNLCKRVTSGMLE